MELPPEAAQLPKPKHCIRRGRKVHPKALDEPKEAQEKRTKTAKPEAYWLRASPRLSKLQCVTATQSLQSLPPQALFHPDAGVSALSRLVRKSTPGSGPAIRSPAKAVWKFLVLGSEEQQGRKLRF